MFFSTTREMALSFKSLTVWLRGRNNLWRNKAERNARLRNKAPREHWRGDSSKTGVEEVLWRNQGLNSSLKDERNLSRWRGWGEKWIPDLGRSRGKDSSERGHISHASYSPGSAAIASLTGLQPVPTPPPTAPHTATRALISTEHWAFIMKCSLLA